MSKNKGKGKAVIRDELENNSINVNNPFASLRRNSDNPGHQDVWFYDNDPRGFYDFSDISSEDEEVKEGDSDEWETDVEYVILDLGTDVNEELINSLDIPWVPAKNKVSETQQHHHDIHNTESIKKAENDIKSNEGQRKTRYNLRSKPQAIDELPPTPKNNIHNSSNMGSNDYDFQFVGLEHGKPTLKIGNNHFEGVLDESIGTDLVFTIRKDEGPPPRISLAYKCHTIKKIRFSRMDVVPKAQKLSTEDDPKLDQDEKNESEMEIDDYNYMRFNFENAQLDKDDAEAGKDDKAN